jgi:hypothetical protein
VVTKVKELTHNQKKHEPLADKQWRVANAAYYLAEKRGFAPGKDLEDWFKAESVIAEAPPDIHHRVL